MKKAKQRIAHRIFTLSVVYGIQDHIRLMEHWQFLNNLERSVNINRSRKHRK